MVLGNPCLSGRFAEAQLYCFGDKEKGKNSFEIGLTAGRGSALVPVSAS